VTKQCVKVIRTMMRGEKGKMRSRVSRCVVTGGPGPGRGPSAPDGKDGQSVALGVGALPPIRT